MLALLNGEMEKWKRHNKFFLSLWKLTFCWSFPLLLFSVCRLVFFCFAFVVNGIVRGV
jgi:hypothetical protein